MVGRAAACPLGLPLGWGILRAPPGRLHAGGPASARAAHVRTGGSWWVVLAEPPCRYQLFRCCPAHTLALGGPLLARRVGAAWVCGGQEQERGVHQQGLPPGGLVQHDSLGRLFRGLQLFRGVVQQHGRGLLPQGRPSCRRPGRGPQLGGRSCHPAPLRHGFADRRPGRQVGAPARLPAGAWGGGPAGRAQGGWPRGLQLWRQGRRWPGEEPCPALAEAARRGPAEPAGAWRPAGGHPIQPPGRTGPAPGR